MTALLTTNALKNRIESHEKPIICNRVLHKKHLAEVPEEGANQLFQMESEAEEFVPKTPKRKGS